MSKEYKEVLKKVNKWTKEHSHTEIRKVARSKPYPWRRWTAKWSTYGAITCLRLGLKPNHITYFWFFLGIAITFLLWPGTLGFGIAFIVLYLFTYYGDYIDGDMARIINHVCPKYKQNIVGTWLDKVAYYAHRSLIFIAIGVWSFQNSGQIYYVFIGLTTAYICLFDLAMKLRVIDALISKDKLDELIEKPKNKSSKKTSFVRDILIPFIRPEPTSILTLAILFNFMFVLAYFYLVLYSLHIIVSFYKISARLSKLYRIQKAF